MVDEQRTIDERNTERRAQILNLAYFNTATMESKPLFKDLFSVQELYSFKIIPIKVEDHDIAFGITNTTSQQTITQIRQRFLDQRVNFYLISDAGYREYMMLYDPPKKVEYRDISIVGANPVDRVAEVSQMLEQVKADDMLAYLVSQAHRLAASDVHIETDRDDVRIRFRIDGVLHQVARLQVDKYRILISAIASAGNVSTSAAMAQQGHISQRVRMADNTEVDVNVRLETVPTNYGMDVVMRLFNMDQSMYSLDRLGLSPEQRAVVDDIINKPSGLVLVVGPTGSGKTTTLYSMLNTLNTEARKIITIEDPTEYQFSGITQISLQSQNLEGGGFAESLRAVLRLDPDVVMVGEIRDMETARTALQAALTGHLVLATFHASSAAAAITRLADIIGENPLFVSAIRLIMAQRLVRRLDDTTKQPIGMDQKTLDTIQSVMSTLPAGVERPNLQSLQLYKPGISDDNPYGYKGQIALREQFLMVGKVAELMTNSHGLTSQQVEAAAIASGMRTMLQDGVLAVTRGETTLEEVYRVVG